AASKLADNKSGSIRAMSIFSMALLIFGVSQLFWAWLAYRFLAARISSKPTRFALCALLLAIYFVGYQFNLGAWSERSTPVHLTLVDGLLLGPFLWWMASSFFGFLIALIFAIPIGIRKAVRRLRSPRLDLPSPERRDLLKTAANVGLGAPFVAGA